MTILQGVPDRPDLLRSVAEVEAEVAAFFGTLSDDELVLRVEEAWTPAEHLQHLVVSVNAVAHGMSLPKWLLRLRFGRSGAHSRSYEEMREVYRRALAEGARARGRFVPERLDPPAAERGALQARVLGRWERANERLRVALGGWSERQLERIGLPHPVLGRLTAREMLFFTLYHNRHHVEAAKRRLPRFSAPAP